MWSEKSTTSNGDVRGTGGRRGEAAPGPATPYHEPRGATQRQPRRTTPRARGHVHREEAVELVRVLRKRGRAGPHVRCTLPEYSAADSPHPLAPPPGRGCAGRGTARRKGSGHRLEVPRAALTSAEEGGSADYRMRFLVALLLSVAVASKTPQPPPHPTLSLRFSRLHLGGLPPELASSFPGPTLGPSPPFSHSAITAGIFQR